MVKVISLSNEAYEKLKRIKGENSFSEVVINIIDEKKENQKGIMELAGAWADDAEKWEKIKEQIYKDRKKFKLRDYKW